MSKRAKLFILVACVLGILLLSTDPETLPSVVLVIPFILLFVFFALALKIILDRVVKRKNTGAVLIMSCLFVVVLALRSLGQLTLRDFIMVAALFVVAFLYMYRRSEVHN